MTVRWSETLMEISKDLLEKKERKLIIDTLEGFGNKSQQCAYSSLQGLVDQFEENYRIQYNKRVLTDNK